LEAFFVSAGVAALAEFGDKTQLLALVLAARFRAPVPVIAGIATAVFANHLISAGVGTLIAAWLSPGVMRWVLVVSFFAAALWMLIPDRRPPAAAPPAGRLGAYGTAVVSFFLLEFGDKTQLATVALAARFQTLLPVVFGTTLGMLLADVPAVLLGEAAARRVPLKIVNRLAAAAFAALGVLVLFGARR
jgi:putative Ca2+/H+ antiporter (TMEM165/GDT1 family)